MKGIVLEIKNSYAAVLQDDGTVIKLNNINYSAGDVINIRKNRTPGQKAFHIAAAVAALIIMVIGAGFWTYNTPVYYVSLDVNPGIIMEVNFFEHVIGIEIINEDAEALMEGLDFKNKNVDDLISELVGLLAEAGYFENEGNIIIGAAAKNDHKAEQLVNKLMAAAREEAENKGFEPEIVAEALGYHMVQEAKELGITPGKLNIITNLLGEDVTSENIDEPVSDLMTRFTAGKGTRGKERAEEAGKPEDSDRAEDDGKPEDTGKPEDVGKPASTGRPEGVGQPENVGKPEGIGRP